MKEGYFYLEYLFSFIFGYVLGLTVPSFSGGIPKGVWVSIFSANKVLYSKRR